MVKFPSSRSVSRAVLGVVACAGLATAALAQGTAPAGTPAADEGKLRPPVPSVPRNEPSDILGIIFAVVLGAAVVGVNMIPGRRGHQD